MRRLPTWMVIALVGAACAGGAESVTTTSLSQPTGEAASASAAETPTTIASAEATTSTAGTEDPTAGDVPASGAGEETAGDAESPVPDGDGTDSSGESGPDQDGVEVEGLGPEASAQVRETAEIVERIRGLEFDGLPSIVVLTPEDFADRIRMEVESELDQVEVDEALYKLLGLLEPDDDLAGLYAELYSESVAGFYSSSDREMVLPRSGEEFSATETMTLLHELVHALTDQHFGFGLTIESLVDDQLFDRAAALTSLVEGDATLAEVLYIQGLTAAERDRLFAEFEQMESPQLDIPLFMEKSLWFPYEQGFDYVVSIWQGDWQGVNERYLDPPISTEEIYQGAAAADRPIEMDKPRGALPEGYEEIYDYTWGLLDILLMFEQVLGAETAVDAAVGWGGGRSLVGYSEEGEVVFVWEYAGDDPGEAEELAGLLYDYAVAGMDIGGLVRTEEAQGFWGADEDYVFVNLIPDGLVMVACSDPQVCPSVTASYRG